MVVPLVKLDTSSWNLAEISARSWNTVVSLPLLSFLVRCKATLIMHLPIMESPSGPWPLPSAIADNWSQWLVKKFSASSTMVLFWLDLSLSTSCLPKHLPMPSWHLGALNWQLRILALSHGEGCGLLFEVHVCYLGEHFLSNAYGSSKGFSWQSHIL